MHRTQFDHARLNLLSLLYDHTCFDYVSRETYAKRSDGAKALRRRPHSVTYVCYQLSILNISQFLTSSMPRLILHNQLALTLIARGWMREIPYC